MRWAGMLSGVVLGLLSVGVHAGQRDRWPLPPERPASLPSSPEAPPAPVGADKEAPAPPVHSAPPAPNAPAPSPSPAASCRAELAAAQVEAEPAEQPPASLSDCGIPSPVRLKAITLASGAVLDLPARPLLDCPFAATFASFVRDIAAPLAAGSLGSTLAALDTGPGYECRGRNQVPGAKTSAHGQGEAVDVMGFVLADKRRIAIAHPSDDREALFVRTVRTAACGWFTTILGPGSDAAHATHMHLDTLKHGESGNYRICE